MSLLSPPAAFLIYVLCISGIVWWAGRLAPRGQRHPEGTAPYASGESSPQRTASPGYAPFFLTALFFAVLHVGALVLGLAHPSPVALIYAAGVLLTLGVFILGGDNEQSADMGTR